jgi:hypothetical protein
MQSRKLSTRVALAVAASLLPVGSVLACPLLDDGANLFQGSSTFTSDFQVSTPGTLTVSFDISSQDPASNFGVNLWSTDAFVGTFMNGVTTKIPVVPGLVYAFSFGEQGKKDISGAFTVDFTFQPNSAPVPLPGSLILLVSGLGLAFVRHSRRVAG